MKGSLTLSVDVSKAFDTVDRRRLREVLEEASADPLLIEVVGKLHIQALYEDSKRLFLQHRTEKGHQARLQACSFFCLPLQLASSSRG